MDEENLFARLRRLANKVENESNLFQERMQKPPGQRVASGVSATNVLKEMQFDIHKLKNDANKELTKHQRESSLQDALIACENLIRVNQRQAVNLKAHLMQYGYQALTQPDVETARKKHPSDGKENTDQDDADTVVDKENQDHPQNQIPTTPPKVDSSGIMGNSDKTPTMEDFGLNMNRVNLFLKKDLQSSSRKVLDTSDLDRNTPLEATAVYQHAGNIHFADSQMSLSQDRDLKYDICAKQVARNLDESHQRPESVEPKSPCLTSSSFLQEPSKLPVQPVMSNLQTNTCTPPTPDCQATELLSVMPQEPKRLMDTLEKAEPQEPDQNYPKVENITPELPSSLSTFGNGLALQTNLATPLHNRNISSHLAFLQEEGTPKTPELTMSLNQVHRRVIPSVRPPPPISSVHHGPHGIANLPTDLQTPTRQRTVPLGSSSGFVHLAPITEQEFSSLSSKMKQNLSIEKVNSWIKVIDNYLAEKPLGEKALYSEDVEMLQCYPWLRAMLMLMVNFQKMERIVDGDDVTFIPNPAP